MDLVYKYLSFIEISSDYSDKTSFYTKKVCLLNLVGTKTKPIVKMPKNSIIILKRDEIIKLPIYGPARMTTTKP